MEILILTGPPYCGKGTQCKILEQKINYKHISTGEAVRKETKQQTLLGIKMAAYADGGLLVSDALMKDLFSKLLDEHASEKGVVLDGYPRTFTQINDLFSLLEEKKLTVQKVIHVAVPSDELLQRGVNRAKTSERSDDQDHRNHTKRLEVYENESKPAIDFLKSKTNFIEVDGLGSIEEVAERIEIALNQAFV